MASAGYDEDGGVLGLVGGLGILLIQGCAIVPGLLPCLLLALPLVLPVVVLGLAAALLWGVTAGAAFLSEHVQAVLDQGVDDESLRGRRNWGDRGPASAASGQRRS
jgi:hypothetical protein